MTKLYLDEFYKKRNQIIIIIKFFEFFEKKKFIACKFDVWIFNKIQLVIMIEWVMQYESGNMIMEWN